MHVQNLHPWRVSDRQAVAIQESLRDEYVVWMPPVQRVACSVVELRLDDHDRAALHQRSEDSDEDIKAGRLVDEEVILRELRSR